MSFTLMEWIAGGFAALLFLYLAARLTSAAVFKSKQQFDDQLKRKKHG